MGASKNRSGHEIFHWNNMTKVKAGDIIFSVYKRNLVSINRWMLLDYMN